MNNEPKTDMNATCTPKAPTMQSITVDENDTLLRIMDMLSSIGIHLFNDPFGSTPVNTGEVNCLQDAITNNCAKVHAVDSMVRQIMDRLI